MPGGSRREALPLKKLAFPLLFFALFALPLPSSAQAAQSAAPVRLLTVDLALQWLPQSQFAGYYMAVQKGFYREAGLYVRLRHADGQNSSLSLLDKGEVQMATSFLTDAIIAAEPDADARTSATLSFSWSKTAGQDARAASRRVKPDIVQLAQIVRRSNLLLVGWRELGIQTAADLSGKKVSYWLGSFSAAYETFFRESGVTPISIPQFYSVNLFLRKGVAACAAMEYNEYNRILQAGVEPDSLTVFSLRDQGFGFPEDGLYARADWFESHRDAALAIRDATMKGWRYANEHRDEVLDYVLAEARRAGISTNRAHEKWMLEHILASIFIDSDDAVSTSLPADEYTKVTTALVQTAMLSSVPAWELFAPFSAGAGDVTGDKR